MYYTSQFVSIQYTEDGHTSLDVPAMIGRQRSGSPSPLHYGIRREQTGKQQAVAVAAVE